MKRREVLTLASASVLGTAGCLGRTEYELGSPSVASIDGPLTLAIEVTDRRVTVDSPGELVLTISNESDRAVQVRNTGVWPLGLLALSPQGSDQMQRSLLLTDAYTDTDRVEVTPRSVEGSNEELVDSLNPSQSVTVPYRLDGARVRRTGVHDLQGYFEPPLLSVRGQGSEDWTTVTDAATVEIAELSLLP
ncbi:hypothetical protein ACFQL1_06370 [Halomicroarcula sp. GCM10025709]|uniref:hypothetical protein n=1 Tax=Haloarcula TaxID=2237 RepID=UPI0024C43210|nr:hypothetical protein [Halomicroarcula sp. YJ-61-S]